MIQKAVQSRVRMDKTSLHPPAGRQNHRPVQQSHGIEDYRSTTYSFHTRRTALELRCWPRNTKLLDFHSQEPDRKLYPPLQNNLVKGSPFPPLSWCFFRSFFFSPFAAKLIIVIYYLNLKEEDA